MWNRIYRADARHLTVVFVISLAWVFLLPPQVTKADVPSDEAVWVCVTVSEFADEFTKLAAYREEQGLTTRVVTLNEILMWAGGQSLPDTPAKLRWFAQRAHAEWNTRYLLLGGDQYDLPAPYTRREYPTGIDIAPLDLYFACLDGDWDGDADGWVAEPGDAYDPVPELAVGRMPVDDAAQAAVMVAKTIRFEGRSFSRRGGVLLAASGTIYSTDDDVGARRVAVITELLAQSDPTYLPTPILVRWEDTPGALVLTPETFIAELVGSDYDHVYYFGQADAENWSCGDVLELGVADLSPLAGAGRFFILNANSCDGADLQTEGIIEHMLAAPDGGAVAARALASLPYVAPMFHFDDAYWDMLASGEHMRLGDVHNAALIAAWDSTISDFFRDHLPLFMLLGDPALVVSPSVPTSVGSGHTFTIRGLEAMPNPFNPSTLVVFAVDGPEQELVPVRVEIFDLKGRLIATLLDAALPPGDHKAVWQAREQGGSAGMFFARVTAGSSAGVVKLVRID